MLWLLATMQYKFPASIYVVTTIYYYNETFVVISVAI